MSNGLQIRPTQVGARARQGQAPAPRYPLAEGAGPVVASVGVLDIRTPAPIFFLPSRPVRRQIFFRMAFTDLTRKYPGTPRPIRRAMARALAQRRLHPILPGGRR